MKCLLFFQIASFLIEKDLKKLIFQQQNYNFAITLQQFIQNFQIVFLTISQQKHLMKDNSRQEENSKGLKNKNKSKHQQNYDEDFEQNYENDFEESSTKKIKQNTQKKNNNNVQQINNDKKSPSPNHLKHNNQSIQKSKRSPDKILKSNNIPAQSKYLYYLKTEFSQSKQQLTQFPPQKINRMNEKLKGYIKRVNDQLSDLINQNMRLLKAGSLKPNQQGHRTVEDEIKLLNQQKKSREILIQNFSKEHKNLFDKFGSLKQEQIQLNVQNQALQIKQLIKQISKEITILKVNTHHEGNKLTVQANYGDRMAETKAKLLNIKKDQQKNSQKLEKCDNIFQELSKKNPQVDYQLTDLIEQAKRQKISLPNGPEDRKKLQKLQQLKKKYQNLKIHKDKSAGLNQTKLAILTRDIDALKSQVQEIQSKFSQLQSRLNSTQEMSKKLIQQSRQKNLQPYIQTHLDFIYKNITEGNPLNGSGFRIQRSKQKGLNYQSSKYGIKKNPSSANMPVITRSQSQAQLKPSFHITKKSPMNLKNKQKNVLKLSQKPAQKRLWKQQNNKVSEQKQNSQQIVQKNSKPFNHKKIINANSVHSENANSVHLQNPKSSEQQKQKNIAKSSQKQNDKSNVLGPKMKFKKQQSNQKPSEDNKDKAVITQKNPNSLKNQENNEENQNSKPQFKIKKAVKQKVQIPEQDLYLFPTQSKQSKLKEQSEKENQIKGKQKQKQKQKLASSNTSTISNTNTKGPNFKINRNSTESNKAPEIQYNKQTNQLDLQVAQQSKVNKQERQSVQVPKQKSIQESFAGRRQIQRKIQRKSQESYVI